MLFSLFPNKQRKLEIQAWEQQIENESFAAHAKKIIGKCGYHNISVTLQRWYCFNDALDCIWYACNVCHFDTSLNFCWGICSQWYISINLSNWNISKNLSKLPHSVYFPFLLEARRKPFKTLHYITFCDTQLSKHGIS